jgi:sigma-B regulation protein RsbU (phosphoserine phosphatase)
MTLTGRLVLTVTVCVALTTAAIAATTGFLASRALIQQAEGTARTVAGLIAESAARSELASAEMEVFTSDEMVAQALALAHLADAVTAVGGTSADLTARFAEIAAKSVIGDIWLIGLDLGVLAAAAGPYYGLADPGPPPSVFGDQGLKALTEGRRFSLAASGHEDEARHVVGVRLGDNRALVTAHPAAMHGQLTDRIGVGATVAALSAQPGIGSIRVVTDALEVVAGEQTAPVSDLEARLAVRAIRTVASQSELVTGGLWVAAPVVDAMGIPTGSVLIRMPRDQLDRLLRDTLIYGGAAALVVFVLGALVAATAARRITRPVVRLTQAAAEMDARTFRPDSLDDVARGRDELGHLATVFQKMAVEVQAREDHLEGLVRARTRDLEDKNAQLEAAKARMDRELDIARTLQATMLPQRMPVHPAYSGRVSMTPAQEMGGDFYDFFPLGSERLGLVIADVSGKGVPAAFFMAISRTILQANAQEALTPGDCLARVNDALCEQNPLDLFVTVFYGVLDLRTGVLAYANGGHNPPLRLLRDGAVEDLPRTGGMALGVMEGMPYAEASVTLQVDDTLFLFTDGISEAMNTDGQEFTEARLSAVLSEARGETVDLVLERVTDAVDAFVGDAPQSDDITCLVLRYKGWSADDPPKEAAAMTDGVFSRRWDLSGDADAVGRVAGDVDVLTADGTLSSREAHAVQLVIEEVLMNAITHALVGVEAPRLSLEIHADARSVAIIVRDNGPPFDPFTDAPPPDLDADLDDRPIGGLGVHLIRSMMDEVAYRRDGDVNEVRMTLNRHPSP